MFHDRYRKTHSLWSTVYRQETALIGLLLILYFTLVAALGPYLAPYEPNEQFVEDRLDAPSARFPFGTDEFGRDVFSRVLHAARGSFQIGLVLVGVAGALGVILGLVAGYVGGWTDHILMLLMDVVFAFPAILLAVAIGSLAGNSLTYAMAAVGIAYVPTFMRVARAGTLAARRTSYIDSAVVIGASTSRIVVKHILPNIAPPILAHAALSFSFVVLAEASLAFIGLGQESLIPSLGTMASASYSYLSSAPWAAIAPGSAIAIAVLGFMLFADGLRDALDPKTRSA